METKNTNNTLIWDFQDENVIAKRKPNIMNQDSTYIGYTVEPQYDLDKHYSDYSIENITLSYCTAYLMSFGKAHFKNNLFNGCNFACSDMHNCTFDNTIMTGSNLYQTDLPKTEKIRKGIKLSEPMIGWKVCYLDNVFDLDDVIYGVFAQYECRKTIVKLEIPRGAIVFSINNGKCRTDKAIVKEIEGGNRAYSTYKYMSYYVGDIFECYDFNCQYNEECAEGIHFFRTREEAIEYSK